MKKSGVTLGQATGGRPRQVAPRPTAKPLGLGLGLGAKQRGAFQQAVQGGGGGQYLGNHPGIQQKIQQINPNSARAGRVQQFMGTGQSQAMPRPPQGQPMRGGGNLNPQQGPQQPLSTMEPWRQSMNPLMQGLNPGMQSVINSRMQQGWSGDNAAQQASLGQQSVGMGQSNQQGFQQAPSQTFTPQQQQGSYLTGYGGQPSGGMSLQGGQSRGPQGFANPNPYGGGGYM
jgi:hypothetical protein